MDKKIPVWLLLLVVFLGLILTVLFGWISQDVERHGVFQQFGKLGVAVATIASYPSLVHDAFIQVQGKDQPLLIENSFPEIDGFKKNGVLQKGAIEDDGYLLLSAYDNSKGRSTVKLIRISDQRVLHEWAPNIEELSKKQHTENRFFNRINMQASRYLLHHPLLLSDGGIVFKSESPLFKIDVCSNMEWVINGVFHHATNQDSDGNLWVPSVMDSGFYDRYGFFGYRDDAITKVSSDGELLFKKSVSKILEDNGYRGFLFGAGSYEYDAIHLNEIKSANYSTQYWKKGDLLVSMRHRSAIFLYRPSTDKVIWLRTGPWLNQHSPDFIGQSKISLLGNDVVRMEKGVTFEEKERLIGGYNNIYLLDLADGEISTPYSELLNQADVHTVTEGRQKILPNGDVFIEETMRGRILRISPERVVWEFTVKIDDQTVGLLSWSRYLTHEQVKDVLPVLEKASCS